MRDPRRADHGYRPGLIQRMAGLASAAAGPGKIERASRACRSGKPDADAARQNHVDGYDDVQAANPSETDGFS